MVAYTGTRDPRDFIESNDDKYNCSKCGVAIELDMSKLKCIHCFYLGNEDE